MSDSSRPHDPSLNDGHEIEETYPHAAQPAAGPWANVPEPPAPESVTLERERRQLAALRAELGREELRLKEQRAQLEEDDHAAQRRAARAAEDAKRRDDERAAAEQREREVFEQELARQVEDFKAREASFVKKLALRAQEAEARLEAARIDAETKLVNDVSLRRRAAETELEQKLQHTRLEGEQQLAKLRLEEEQRMAQRLLESERRAEQVRTQLDETIERRRLEEEARFEQWRREQEQRVMQALEQRRLDDEQRLTAALAQRREQEESRLQAWVEERRIAADRVIAQRRADEDRRMEAEHRAFTQMHDRRLAEEEQKLAAWRADEERR